MRIAQLTSFKRSCVLRVLRPWHCRGVSGLCQRSVHALPPVQSCSIVELAPPPGRLLATFDCNSTDICWVLGLDELRFEVHLQNMHGPAAQMNDGRCRNRARGAAMRVNEISYAGVQLFCICSRNPQGETGGRRLGARPGILTSCRALRIEPCVEHAGASPDMLRILDRVASANIGSGC